MVYGYPNTLNHPNLQHILKGESQKLSPLNIPLKIELGLFIAFKGYIWTAFIWLVVSTRLKNISQIGSFPQVGAKIKNV